MTKIIEENSKFAVKKRGRLLCEQDPAADSYSIRLISNNDEVGQEDVN
jgi:hypothetical protein